MQVLFLNELIGSRGVSFTLTPPKFGFENRPSPEFSRSFPEAENRSNVTHLVTERSHMGIRMMLFRPFSVLNAISISGKLHVVATIISVLSSLWR